jgi:hypothetical protein
LAALRKCGIIDLDYVYSNVDALCINTLEAFNMMIKQWQTEGIKLWTVVEQQVPLTASKTSYTIAPSGGDITSNKPLRVIQAWLRNTTITPNVDTQVQILSKQEYNMLGSKFSTGTVNSLYLNPGVSSSVLNLYLTSDTLSSTRYTLYMVVQVPLADVLDDGTADPQFPNEWYSTLVWNLADEIAVENGVPEKRRQEIALKANMYKSKLEDWDVENESTFFVPDMRQSTFSYSKYA